MDRRVYAAVQSNARRVIAAQGQGATEQELEALREAGRAEVQSIREQIARGEPDTGDQAEIREWAEQQRRKNAHNIAAEWFWNRVSG